MARGSVSIVVERCKACGFCVEFCPSKVLALSDAFNSKGGMYCPDFAIHGFRTDKTAAAAATEVEKESGDAC